MSGTRAIEHMGVVGAGAWGTALATVACRAGREVTIWAREPEVVESINEGHENRLFLPDIPLDAQIHATSDLADLANADTLLLVPPAQHLRAVASELAPHLRPDMPAIICAKGIERGSDALMTDVLSESLPTAVPAILSGPSFAADVASGLPTAVTLAIEDQALGEEIVAAIGYPTFRPYLTDDLVGAQIGGAVKNVLAIACGVSVGKGFGESARAALTTRGYGEMRRLGLALGGQAVTMTGLSGLGDLILTCGSTQSRNMSLGLALGEGKTLDEVLGARRSVSEGVYTAGAVRRLAARFELDLPVCEAVAELVEGEASVDEAIEHLLARPFTTEV